MNRETSRQAYRQLVESGQLKGKQQTALLNVIEHGPATSAEIIQRISPNTNLWRARFTELQARGLIVEVGQRKCTVTGRTALVWEYSGRTKPLEPKHRTGSKELRALLKQALAVIEEPRIRGSYQELRDNIREALR